MEDEYGTLSQPAGDADPASVLGNDPLADGQAKTGAPIFFRGKVWLKDALQILFFDAHSRVRETDVNYIVTGIGLDCQPPAARHSVASV